MKRKDIDELETLLNEDYTMNNMVYRVHSRMLKVAQIFNDSYDKPEFFENNSFGGDRTNNVPDNDRINKTITDIYAVLVEKNMVEDYEFILDDLVMKLNTGEMDSKTAKIQLIKIAASIGMSTTFYSVYDEYLNNVLIKEREKNKELKISK